MNKNYLYYFVKSKALLNIILESKLIKTNPNIIGGVVCTTRNKNYLNSRGIRIVLNKDTLKYNHKIFCFDYYGWLNENNYTRNGKPYPKLDEAEERVIGDIDLNKHCVRIDVDFKKYYKFDDLTFINFRNVFNLKPFEY